MTTRNLVPRGDSQGKIGISGLKWEEINSVTLKVTNLQNVDGSLLLKKGPGIEDIALDSGQLKISLDDSFLTSLGFNADGTLPVFTSTSKILAGDSIVAAINKLDTAAGEVASPTGITFGQLHADAIVTSAETLEASKTSDTTLATPKSIVDWVEDQNYTTNTGDITGVTAGTGLTGGGTSGDLTINLENTAVTPAAYGSATSIPTFTVDQQGRLTAAGSASISTSLTIQTDDAADNSVALATDKLKLLGGTGITSSNSDDDVTFTLDNTAVTPATYGDADSVSQFTVDQQGRITSAANVDINITSGQISDATHLNTASKIVLRDGSGDFAAGTITATLSGNATSATSAGKWTTARTLSLGGDLSGTVDIDGSDDFTLTATVAANSVALGNDTTGNYVASLTAGAGLAAFSGGEGATETVAVDGVLEDLDTLGAASGDGEFIVATGAGAFAYESGSTVRDSLELGTSDSPSFAGLTLSDNLLIDNQKELRLGETDGNGTEYVAIKSPASLDASYTLTLPANDGTENYVLKTDGAGGLSWSAVTGAAGSTNSFAVVAVSGQDNLEADTASDTLTLASGNGISLSTTAVNDTVTITASGIATGQLAADAGIVDTQLATISTANKVSLTALNIDGGADIDADLADGDLIIVDDGAGGTNKKSALSRISTYIRSKDSNITTLSGLTSAGTEGNTLTAEGSLQVDQNLTVTGNLVVNGTSVTVNTANLSVEDPLISLAKSNNASDSLDIGFYGLYDTSGSQDLYAGLFRDASDGKFRLFKDLQDAPTTTVDTSGTGYSVGTIVADVEGNATSSTKWSSGRTVTFATGDITGDFTIDGSASVNNVELTIVAGSVENSMLANDAVGADELAANAVVNASIAADAAIDVDKIDWTSEGGVLTDFAQDDKLFVYDTDGTSLKSITLSNLEDSIFGNVSGDITIAAEGVASIGNQKVTNAMLADDAVGADELAANAVVNSSVVDGSIKADKLDIDGSTDIGDDLVDADLVIVDDGAAGTNRKSALSRMKKYIFSAVSGDATASDSGELTIAAGAVENSMLANDAVGADELASNAVVNASVSASAAIDITKLDFVGADQLGGATIAQDDDLVLYDKNTTTNKRVSFSNLEDTIFANITTAAGDATIAAGGEISIGNQKVTDAMLAGSISNSKLSNSGISLGGISISLGGTDATPAFNLADATGYLTSNLSGTITNAQLAGSIADSNLNQITTADKVSVTALDLDGATASGDLVAADLILVDDGANGTNRKATLTQLVSFLQNNTGLTSLSSLAGLGTITSGTWQGTAIADTYVANDLTISGGAIDNSAIGSNTAAEGKFTTLEATTSLKLTSGATVTGINDTDNMTDASATTIATSESIKAYVDAQVTAQDLDVSDGSSNIDIDLDSETLTIAGGTGLSSTAAGTTVTLAIDSTVTTLTGSQELTNKTITSPTVSGLTLSDSSIVFEGATSNEHETTLTVTDPTADRTITLPNATTTLVGHDTTDTLTNKSIDADNNTITNLEVDNLKAGVLDTDLSTVSANDDTVASSKAVKAYVDDQLGRFGGIFKTDSADNNHANDDYNRDVLFDSSPLVRSHFGPFAYDLGQLASSGGSDIIFFGVTATGASDRHFLVIGSGDDKGDTKFTGANENTP